VALPMDAEMAPERRLSPMRTLERPRHRPMVSGMVPLSRFSVRMMTCRLPWSKRLLGTLPSRALELRREAEARRDGAGERVLVGGEHAEAGERAGEVVPGNLQLLEAPEAPELVGEGAGECVVGEVEEAERGG
jgi:hypothetical protein